MQPEEAPRPLRATPEPPARTSPAGRTAGTGAAAAQLQALREELAAARRELDRQREELAAAQHALQQLLEATGEAAVFLDGELRITRYTPPAVALFRLIPGDLGRPLTDLAGTLDYPQLAADARRALEGQQPVQREVPGRDGSWFVARLLPCRPAGNGGAGLVLAVADASRRRCAEQARRASEEQLREARQALERSQAELAQALQDAQDARKQLDTAEAAKDRFLAVLAHELRNPLASIASASELLLMPKLPSAALEKAAQVVQRQARAMKALLDEMLDASRLTLGRVTLTRRPVVLQDVIHAALEATRPLVQAAGHDLVLSLPPHEVEVDADPLRLGQVVSNLVSNAAKYTPECGRIAVSMELFQDEVVVTVADNGIGMRPEDIDRMFELFSQVDGSAPPRTSGGLGIGLALTRNIVELHGGWIMASSAGPGQGCQMRVGLPLLRVVQAPRLPPGGEPARQQPTPAPAAQGELVLVADDNGDAAWGLAKLLELSGFRAVTARSGNEALRLAESQRPAIALLDIGMPDLSGHDVARRLREQPWGRDLILIAATGWGQEVDVRDSLAAGFDAHLTKPLHLGRVKALIDELAARRRYG